MISGLAYLALLVAPQDHPGVDSMKVDAAIKKGVKYLRGAGSPPAYAANVPWHVPDSDELILLTLLHAGVPVTDPAFQKLFKKAMASPLVKTYKVCLQAMLLEELDRRAYQIRILRCAQFIVDNQCTNGQWGYGSHTPAIDVIPTKAPRNPVQTVGRPGRDGKPKKPRLMRTFKVKQTRYEGASGDNSNSQYAALGLRACKDAGIQVNTQVLQLARKWWKDTAVVEGDKKAVATGGGGVPAGWGYRINDHSKPYGSMTAGAFGAVAIYDHLMGKDWKRDPVAQGGLAWLTKHFSVTQNVGGRVHFGDGSPNAMLYYYLYALERAGVLTGTVDFGSHDWYKEGARFILKSQKPDGSWHSGTAGAPPAWDTCFAILFLKRATRPLVASTDERIRR